jgi:hypothetical protein
MVETIAGRCYGACKLGPYFTERAIVAESVLMIVKRSSDYREEKENRKQ